jgi:branched-chain amino acid transport system permease protein
VAIGVLTVLLAGMLQRIVPFILDELNLERDWLYSKVTKSLTWFGAVVLFVLATAVAALVLDRRERRRGRLSAEGRPDTGALRRSVLLLAGAVGLVALPLLAGSIVSEVLGRVGVYLLLALGLNIVTGYAGMLHLGFGAFMAIGAYSVALLTGANLVTAFGLVSPKYSADLSFYVALVIVVVIGAVVGALLAAPVLRLRGDYLAIVTLAFAQIVLILATSSWLQPITGGPQGLRDVTPAPLFGYSFRDPQHFYYLVLFFCALAVYVSWRLAWSRTGRAWNAMREDEQVADAMGVSTSRYKLLGFAIGGALGAVGGALFAVKVGTVQPNSFEIIVSITVLAAVILGGLGSVPGVVLGTVVLIGLPGLLSQLEEYRLLIYGAALVAIMILRPQGLVPNVRRSRELQEEERTQDAWQQIYAGADPERDDAPEATPESAT